METLRSTPSFFEFSPLEIISQAKAMHLLENKADYSLGVHELLLSGAVGSAKSILAAHMAVKHCIEYPRARIMLGRRSLPDLKDTIFTKIVEHLEDDENRLVEGRDYFVNWSTAHIWFRNGSEIISRSWADKKYKKFRSLELSAAIFEELTENDQEASQAYFETKNRVGRLHHIPVKWIICCTNPDSPRHWAYEYFIKSKSFTRHVIYSKTRDNPFLPSWYVEQLRKDMDPRMAMRMLDGEWIEIDEDRVYHSYLSERNFKPDVKWEINPSYPITLCFDFNIGQGKPMSSACYQFISDHFHIFGQNIVHGARTMDIMEEWLSKGFLQKDLKYIIHGDATGEARDTRSIMSDYDLIKRFMAQHGFQFEMQVPRANPPIRTRHNKVNAYCYNDLGQVRLTVYNGCDKVDEGFRLTALKKGGQYIEDDSKDYQHVTTALGYGIVYDTNRTEAKVTSHKR